ncbi:hypothetical protein HK104_003418 [Borealophlyctis nickersoniae]|nr:hypothetical protein HK104_003418 [Borealophlyctis nickersoniae]
MLDHALGRPSAGLKRLEVIAVALFSAYILRRGPESDPKLRIVQWINKKFGHLPAWKIVFGTLASTFILNNVFLLLYLNAPEPMARMYTRNFYRATYVITSLDAACLTAMRIRPKPLRDFMTLIFMFFYLLRPEAADSKVKKHRTFASVDMMRTSWEDRLLNPYIRLITLFPRGFLNFRRNITISRPEQPSITSFPRVELKPIKARLYFSGTAKELRRSKQLILQLPGGGFVTMSPKCHDDYVSMWARQTKIPIVSIDYGKAPEHPYPWGLEECFDAYRSIVESNGETVGFEGWYTTDEKGNRVKKDPIKIVMVGDSAGGNLAVGVVMRCLETHEKLIQTPAGLILMYPCLSFDIACWMPQEQLSLIRAESHKSLSMAHLIDSKSTIKKLSPLTQPEAPRRIDVLKGEADRSKSWYHWFRSQPPPAGPSIPSSLSMTSRMSYFTDRIIAPEMMRAMALLYLGGSPEPADLASDYYLSPVIAPDELLVRFPKTYFICGEKDPFVDDTVVFAGRMRDNKRKARKEWDRMMRRANAADGGSGSQGPFNRTNPPRHLDLPNPGEQSMPDRIRASREVLQKHIFSRDPDSMVQVKILEGISHAFMNMVSILPEAVQATRLTSNWFLDMFADKEAEKNIGSCPDAAEDLTEYMIDEINRTDATPLRSPSVNGLGPYYPMYGAPMHSPSPHIRLNGVQPDTPGGRVWGAEGEIEQLDVVKEKHILERRRNQLASTLYRQDS